MYREAAVTLALQPVLRVFGMWFGIDVLQHSITGDPSWPYQADLEAEDARRFLDQYAAA